MSWRDDAYVSALVRGMVLLMSAICIMGGVACLIMYLIGFQRESLYASVAMLASGALMLMWHMAEINGLHGKRRKG